MRIADLERRQMHQLDVNLKNLTALQSQQRALLLSGIVDMNLHCSPTDA